MDSSFSQGSKLEKGKGDEVFGEQLRMANSHKMDGKRSAFQAEIFAIMKAGQIRMERNQHIPNQCADIYKVIKDVSGHGSRSLQVGRKVQCFSGRSLCNH